MFYYYFVVEEKFTSWAGILASATTDRVFEWAASDNKEFDNQ
jgi:hypothetical protein